MKIRKRIYYWWFRFLAKYMMSLLPFLWDWDMPVLHPVESRNKTDGDSFERFLEGKNYFFSVEIFRKNDHELPQNRSLLISFTLIRAFGTLGVDIFYEQALCTKILIFPVLVQDFGKITLDSWEDTTRANGFFLRFFPSINFHSARVL